jgi:hypothetical protein
MERIITKELLTDFANKALKELDRNDCTLLLITLQPTNENLPEMGSATLDEIAPRWCVDFLCDGLKPLIITVQDKPGVTDAMIANELKIKLGQYVSTRP